MPDPLLEHVYLGRQPILARDQSVFAYELLFRSGQSAASHVTDDMLATANVIINTISQIGIDDVLDRHFGFINVSRDLLMSDMLELLPSDRLVLELLETVEVDAAVVARCRQLKSLGFSLAIDDYRYQPGYDELFEVVDYVKFDLMTTSADEIAAYVQGLMRWPDIQFLAEKVEERAQFERYHTMGFSLFQGYFFARPAIISGQKIKPGQVTLMRVMSQLLGDAEVDEINQTFQGCPNLTLGLLRLVNSVATGLRSKIGSLPHALVVLGRRQLLRWVQLLLYAHSDSGVPPPLMTMVAVRAKVMELLCERYRDPRMRQQDMRDRAFMTGILSLVGVAVGMELSHVLPPLNLADDVNRALLEHTGPLGHMLLLVEKMELGDFAAAAELLPALDIAAEDLNDAHLGAMRWARSLDEAAA
jgi:c-di-GMP-related signal transduction protein